MGDSLATISKGITTAKETENAITIQLKIEGIPDETVYFKLEKLIKGYKKVRIPADKDCIISSQRIEFYIDNLDIPTFKYLAEKHKKTPRKNYNDCMTFTILEETESDERTSIFIYVSSKKVIIEL